MSEHSRLHWDELQAAVRADRTLYGPTVCNGIPNCRDFHGVDIVRDVFIETGTNQAWTAKSACHAGFSDIHTIDIDSNWYAEAVRHFACVPWVHPHHGHSAYILKKIIDPSRDTTFWLDAHTADDCPLLDEIEVILGFPWRKLPLILIDDMQFMGDKGWPDLADVVAAVGQRYECEVRGRVLFCFPKNQ